MVRLRYFTYCRQR